MPTKYLIGAVILLLTLGLGVAAAQDQIIVVKRASVASNGVEGEGAAYRPALSATEGRYVAFVSEAANLVSGDTNGDADIFVHDRQTGQTERISVDSDGTEANGLSDSPDISADGRYVVFSSHALLAPEAEPGFNIFIHDRQTGQTSLVGPGATPAISGDGQYVVYYEPFEVYLYDGQTTIEVAPGLAPDISGDSEYVAFQSDAANLIEGDSNGVIDIFVYDRQTTQIERVSVASDGTQADQYSFAPAIASDGRYVAFASDATNLVSGDTNGVTDIFVHDRENDQTRRVSVDSSGKQANGASPLGPAISADGRYVAFQSDATNLVSGDTNGHTDIFVHDRQTGQTTRVSVDADGTAGNHDSRTPDISGNGPAVAFASAATNLVANDNNSQPDIFLYYLDTLQSIYLPIVIKS